MRTALHLSTIRWIVRGLPSARIKTTGFPRRESSSTNRNWASSSVRSSMFPINSQYAFSPRHAITDVARICSPCCCGDIQTAYRTTSPGHRRHCLFHSLPEWLSRIVFLSPRIEILFVSLPCDCPSAVQRRKKIGGRTGHQEREFPFSTAARWRCYSAMLWLPKRPPRFNSELRFDPTSAAAGSGYGCSKSPPRIFTRRIRLTASSIREMGHALFPDEREEEVVEAESSGNQYSYRCLP